MNEIVFVSGYEDRREQDQQVEGGGHLIGLLYCVPCPSPDGLKRPTNSNFFISILVALPGFHVGLRRNVIKGKI